MEQELLNLIRQKLPEAEVGAIKNIIEELEVLKEDNKQLNHDLAQNVKFIKEQEEELEQYKSKDTQYSLLSVREQKILQKEKPREKSLGFLFGASIIF